MKESFETFCIVLVLLLFAVGLTYFEEALEKSGRPSWLVAGAQFLSVMAFVTDALVIFGIFAKVGCHAIKNIVSDVRSTHDV